LRLDLTDESQLGTVRRRRPLDEGLAAAVSPSTSSPEAPAAVHEDEADAAMVSQVRREPGPTTA
jgi:hypothetical protein